MFASVLPSGRSSVLPYMYLSHTRLGKHMKGIDRLRKDYTGLGDELNKFEDAQ